MDYKEETIAVYDLVARKYELLVKDYTNIYLVEEVNLFLKALPGKRILDLGSGPGRDAVIFRERGYQPLCVDLSREMVKLCQEKGLEARVMDLENLQSDETFDGVWAYTSLLHVPKVKMAEVLSRIILVLKPEGAFFLGMKEGTEEEMKKYKLYPGQKRLMSLYQDEELRELLSVNFELLYFSKTIIREDTYFNYLSRKKE